MSGEETEFYFEVQQHTFSSIKIRCRRVGVETIEMLTDSPGIQ